MGGSGALRSRRRTPRRRGRARVAAVGALLAAVTVTGAPTPAAADTGWDYVADPAPLSAGGVDYADSFWLFGQGALFVTASEHQEPTFVAYDDTPVAGVPNGTGDLYPFHAVLAEMHGRRPTIYLDALILSSQSQPASCDGVEAALAGAGITCDDFAADVLVPNGPGNDFTFTGLDGFEGAVTPVAGFGAPSLRYAPGTPMPQPPADYYASASPLAFGGRDFADNPLVDDDDGEPGPEALLRGAVWMTGAGEPQLVSADDTPIPGIPSRSGPTPIHVAMVEVEGYDATLYIDDIYFTELSDPAIPTTCAGLETVFGFFGDDPPDVTCVNFKAGVFVPGPGGSALAASYVFTGLSDFEVPGTVSVVAGFSSPSLTLGPRPADPADPTGPTPPAPAGPTDPTDPADDPGRDGEGAREDGRTAPGELPRTGAAATDLLLAAGLALLALGTVMLRHAPRVERRPPS